VPWIVPLSYTLEVYNNSQINQVSKIKRTSVEKPREKILIKGMVDFSGNWRNINEIKDINLPLSQYSLD